MAPAPFRLSNAALAGANSGEEIAVNSTSAPLRADGGGERAALASGDAGADAGAGATTIDVDLLDGGADLATYPFSWRKLLLHMGCALPACRTNAAPLRPPPAHPGPAPHAAPRPACRPGFLMCIAYIDPGNLEADLQTGALTGYSLLWVLLWSTWAGYLLQSLAARMGVATGRHLAQHCRAHYPTPVRITLWLMAELAIIGSDVQEVVGTALALALLSGGRLPLWAGVAAAAAAAYCMLLLERMGARWLEGAFQALIAVMAAAMGALFFMADVPFGRVAEGEPGARCAAESNCARSRPLRLSAHAPAPARPAPPRSRAGLLFPRISGAALPTAAGLLGAILMPHNLFLHSALVAARPVSAAGGAPRSVAAKRDSVRYYNLESALALGVTLAINTAVISVFARGFYGRDAGQSVGLENAGQYLGRRFGRHFAVIWAVGLLAAGQSSATTGTYAGQFVMGGARGGARLWPVRRSLERLAASFRGVALVRAPSPDPVPPLRPALRLFGHPGGARHARARDPRRRAGTHPAGGALGARRLHPPGRPQPVAQRAAGGAAALRRGAGEPGPGARPPCFFFLFQAGDKCMCSFARLFLTLPPSLGCAPQLLTLTSSAAVMGPAFVNGRWTAAVCWAIACGIAAVNGGTAYQAALQHLPPAPAVHAAFWALVALYFLLVVYLVAEPWLPRALRKRAGRADERGGEGGSGAREPLLLPGRQRPASPAMDIPLEGDKKLEAHPLQHFESA
jgi:natural resistance-associated macrophage protein